MRDLDGAGPRYERRQRSERRGLSAYDSRSPGKYPAASAVRLQAAPDGSCALQRHSNALPELNAALQEGALSWSAVRELTRVATPENQAEWLTVARGKTQRQIEQLVAGRKPGDGPNSPAGPARHVLRFEVSADTLATFRDAMAKLRRMASESLDDDAALLLLARHVLGAPSDDGRSAYQIALTACEHCERGFQQSQGELLEVDSASREMAECDAQRIGSVDTSAHVGKVPARAKQSIPPKTRRLVLRRDHGRCTVPGCTHSSFVDVHHLDLRSEGGKHDPDRLVVLCGAHHRALHRGQLQISGSVSQGLAFKHADGSEYGRAATPNAAEAYAKAFQALRSLGFRESEARSALAQLQQRRPSYEQSTEQVLRAALELLTRQALSAPTGARASSRREPSEAPGQQL